MDIDAISRRCGMERTNQSRRHGAETIKQTSQYSGLVIHRVVQNREVATSHPNRVERREKTASKGRKVARGSCMTDGFPEGCFFVTAEGTSLNVGACKRAEML
jgi:hypothetical protein